MIKHETSRADVKSSRSLSFNKLLIEENSHPVIDTEGLRDSQLTCKVTVQMSTLQTFKLVVKIQKNTGNIKLSTLNIICLKLICTL